MFSSCNEKRENEKHKSPCREKLTNREGRRVLHHFCNILLPKLGKQIQEYLLDYLVYLTYIIFYFGVFEIFY